MIFPNFFIVGGPKCGTTALSEYLRGHPNVLVSWPKETHYFADDLGDFRRVKTRDEYLGLFPVTDGVHLAAGEASVFYLYSEVALQNIQAFNANARIIAMVRNPVDVVHALHSQLVFTFSEDELDFEKAWRLQASRREGKNIPQTCPNARLLQYEQIAKFGTQIEKLFGLFNRKQVLVIAMEDFSARTKSVYERVLSFLNVPSDARTDFPKVNVNTVHARPWLGKFLYHPPYPVRWLEPKIKKLLSALGIREFRGWHRVLSLTSRNEKRPPLSPELRRELQCVFRDDVSLLSELTEMDLMHWVEASPQRV